VPDLVVPSGFVTAIALATEDEESVETRNCLVGNLSLSTFDFDSSFSTSALSWRSAQLQVLKLRLLRFLATWTVASLVF